MKIQIDETPVLKASVESIDIAKVNAYLAKLGQTPLNEENEKALLYELVNLSILLDIDKIYYPSLGGLQK